MAPTGPPARPLPGWSTPEPPHSLSRESRPWIHLGRRPPSCMNASCMPRSRKVLFIMATEKKVPYFPITGKASVKQRQNSVR